jgi:hypothetical protein
LAFTESISQGLQWSRLDYSQTELSIGDDVPHSVQRLCNDMRETAMASKTIDAALIEKLPFTIGWQNCPHYEMLWQTVTPLQRLLLLALSEEQDALPLPKDFQLRHGIRLSSSIKASLDSLCNKGFLITPPKHSTGSQIFSCLIGSTI